MNKLYPMFATCHRLVAILAVAYLCSNPAIAQVYYDDWPTTRATNDRDSVLTDKSGNVTTNFVPIGTTWNRRVLTYFFENGTPDINANDERQAFRDALAIWTAQTNLRFLEVCNANDADIAIRWAAGNHGDAEPFDGANGNLAHTLGGPPPTHLATTRVTFTLMKLSSGH